MALQPGIAQMPLLATAGYITKRTTGGSALDCCVFVQAIVTMRYVLPAPTEADLALWRIFADSKGNVPTSRVWGPPEAAFRARVTYGNAMLNGTPFQAHWHVCQGWRTLRKDGTASPAAGDTGHTFLLYRGAPGGLDTIVQSSQAEGPRIDFGTWEDYKSRYPAGLCIVALRK